MSASLQLPIEVDDGVNVILIFLIAAAGYVLDAIINR